MEEWDLFAVELSSMNMHMSTLTCTHVRVHTHQKCGSGKDSPEVGLPWGLAPD